MTTKTTHPRGGARKGAGRKGLGNTRRVTVCLTEELIPIFKEKGGAKWLRNELAQTNKSTDSVVFDSFLFPPDVPTSLRVPLYQFGVQAGFPSPAESYVDKSLDLNEYLVSNPAATLFVHVVGDSMNRAGMEDGDLLVVDRSLQPKNEDIVIMSIDDEFTVKRYLNDENGLRLLPDSFNPIYKPIRPKEFEEWRFIGVVKFTIKSN